MAKTIVHVETNVVTVFGVLDDEGNVATKLVVASNKQQQDDPLTFTVFNKENFDKAYDAITKVKDQLKEQVAKEENTDAGNKPVQ